jgi:creatinine amidohydrolase
VRERLAALPALLAAVPAAVGPALLSGDARARRFVVTGGGFSEGPARYLVAWLVHELRLDAIYLPLSAFAGPAHAPPGDTLILFSQGLAPNARLPLAHRRAYRDLVLFTSVVPDATGGATARLAARLAGEGAGVCVLPPREEGGLLLRVLGPPIQTLAAALFAAGLGGRRGAIDVDALVEDYRRPPPPGSLVHPHGPADVALVTAGLYGDFCHGLRWKLLEGLYLADPPVWDILAFPHGPFQQIRNRPFTLVALTPQPEADLVDRLAELLVPARHRLLLLEAPRRGPLAYFAHDALFDHLLLAALEATGLDLIDWPGRGYDDPLYGVDPQRRGLDEAGGTGGT